MSYLSVLGNAQIERVVEKSRFLSYVSHCEGEEDARAYLAQIRSLHPLATHVCWAFVADRVGNELRFSDDGEPLGTAGMPILNVIRAQKLYQTVVAVVRYFGGIKLGAGGLVRAYSSAAAEGLDAAKKCLYEMCVEGDVAVDYSQIDATLRYFTDRHVDVLSSDYAAQVVYRVAVKQDAFEKFSAELKNHLNGKVKILRGQEYFYPFPLA